MLPKGIGDPAYGWAGSRSGIENRESGRDAGKLDQGMVSASGAGWAVSGSCCSLLPDGDSGNASLFLAKGWPRKAFFSALQRITNRTLKLARHPPIVNMTPKPHPPEAVLD